LNFKGKNTEGGNLLTWTTANEVNNKGFYIERASPQPPQGASMTWETLGFVNAEGKAATYEFIDKAPLGGWGTYRLRQTDNDGKETLSKVISVANVNTHGRVYLYAYPSVTTGFLTIETSETSPVEVFNLLGQQVLHDVYHATRCFSLTARHIYPKSWHTTNQVCKTVMC
jgi:hypothetical protein